MTDQPIPRVRYQEGQTLTADDLNTEQAYRIAARRRHNIAGHTWGIVQGLELKQAEGRNGFYVTPGVAIDGFGRELIVSENSHISQDAIEHTLFKNNSIDVWLLYQLQPLTTPIGPNPPDLPSQMNRWQETAIIRLRAANPDKEPNWLAGVTPIDQSFTPYETLPDNPKHEWPVFLGRIENPTEILAADILNVDQLVEMMYTSNENVDLVHMLLQFQATDFTDPAELLFLLRDITNPLSAYLVEHLLKFQQDDLIPGKQSNLAEQLDGTGGDLETHLYQTLLFFQKQDITKPMIILDKLKDTQADPYLYLLGRLLQFREADIVESRVTALLGRLRKPDNPVIRHLQMLILPFLDQDILAANDLLNKLIDAKDDPYRYLFDILLHFSDADLVDDQREDLAANLSNLVDTPYRQLYQALLTYQFLDLKPTKHLTLTRKLTGNPIESVNSPKASTYNYLFGRLLEFQDGDIQHLPTLVSKLIDGTNPLASYLFDSFSNALKTRLGLYNPNDPSTTNGLEQDVQLALNNVLFNEEFYIQVLAYRAHVSLSNEAAQFLTSSPNPGLESKHFNRLVLEDMFEQGLAKLYIIRGTDSSDSREDSLIEALNRLLFLTDLYKQQEFYAEVNNAMEPHYLADPPPTGLALTHLNRRLLDIVFTDEIYQLSLSAETSQADQIDDAMVADLNRLILSPALYEATIFADYVTPALAEAFAQTLNPRELSLVRLNRQLLERVLLGQVEPLRLIQENISDKTGAVVETLNQLFNKSNLYNEAHFGGVAFSDFSDKFAVNPKGLDLHRLNRLLLEATFSSEVKQLLLYQETPPNKEIPPIIETLNRLLLSEGLYKGSIFGDKIDEQFGPRYEQSPKDLDLIQLNRELLQSYFFLEIKPFALLEDTPDNPTQIATDALNLLLTTHDLYDTALCDDQLIQEFDAEYNKNLSCLARYRLNRKLLDQIFMDEVKALSLSAEAEPDDLTVALLDDLNRLLLSPVLHEPNGPCRIEGIVLPIPHYLVSEYAKEPQDLTLKMLNRIFLDFIFGQEVRAWPNILYGDFDSEVATRSSNLAVAFNRLLQGDLLLTDVADDVLEQVLITLSAHTIETRRPNPDSVRRIYLNRLFLEDTYFDYLFQDVLFRNPMLQKPWTHRLNQLIEGPLLSKHINRVWSEEISDLLAQEKADINVPRLNRLMLEQLLGNHLRTYLDRYRLHPFARPYIGLVGESFTHPTEQAQLRIGSQSIPDQQSFAVDLPDHNNQVVSRLTMGVNETMHINGHTYLRQNPDLRLVPEADNLLRLYHLQDVSTLMQQLKGGNSAFSQYLKDQLSPPVQNVIEKLTDDVTIPVLLQRALLRDLNDIIRNESLYESRRFLGITLRPETQQLLREKPQGKLRIRLNRLLLEDAYPSEIARTYPVSDLTLGTQSGLVIKHQKSAPEAKAPWQIYQASLTDNELASNQLRFEIDHPADKEDPSNYQFLIGHYGYQEHRSQFIPALSVTASNDVIIAGDLNIEGVLGEGPIQADANDPRFAGLMLESWESGVTSAGQQVDTYYDSVLLLEIADGIEPRLENGRLQPYTLKITNFGEVPLSNLEVVESVSLPNASLPNRIVFTPATPEFPFEVPTTFTVSHPRPGEPSVSGQSGEVVIILSATSYDPAGRVVSTFLTRRLPISNDD